MTLYPLLTMCRQQHNRPVEKVHALLPGNQNAADLRGWQLMGPAAAAEWVWRGAAAPRLQQAAALHLHELRPVGAPVQDAIMCWLL